MFKLLPIRSLRASPSYQFSSLLHVAFRQRLLQTSAHSVISPLRSFQTHSKRQQQKPAIQTEAKLLLESIPQVILTSKVEKIAKEGEQELKPQLSEITQEVSDNDKRSIAENAFTIPNILTMSRIATTPFIGYYIATGHSTAAISLFIYSCITDFLDGFIARRYNLKSVLGSVLDPAADKFLMTVCTVALSVQSAMPWYVAAIIVGRDVMLSFMGFFVRFRSLPPPRTLGRFLDLSIPTHTVHPNLLGKVNTALQMFYIGGLVFLPVIDHVSGAGDMLSVFFEYAGLLVAATTFASGASYVFRRNAFKALK